ncbi:MAG: hypothetical protein HQ523_05315 [Lentisphaerae bacterium]|nr:hypothetical protein [Lentisphaerota bacterium]
MKRYRPVTLAVLTVLATACARVPDAPALSSRDVLRILADEVLQPSADTNGISAFLTSAPLSTGIVEQSFGGGPTVDVSTVSGNAQWFALVDLHPCEFFEHDVKYVFIDDVSGVVTVTNATDWPTLDGYSFDDGPGATDKLIAVYPIVPRPDLQSAVPDPGALLGDYGDAPDGGPAYPGVMGRFATLYSTTNSPFAEPGGHTHGVGTRMLGVAATSELGPSDPADPDGVHNLDDADSDERMFLAWDPNSAPPRALILFDTTIITPPGPVEAAVTETLYFNALLDFDQGGSWSNGASGAEWAVTNQALIATIGQTDTFASDWFTWGAPSNMPTLVWMRTMLTTAGVPLIYGADGWSGGGHFGEGEVEDFKVYLDACPGDGCPPPPPPPGEPDDDDEPEDTPPPGPKIGWNDLPVRYFALVVQGPDHKGQTAAAEAGALMSRTLKAQGYQSSGLSGATATVANMAAWLAAVKAQVACQDKILIYFVAHGAKNTPGGSMRLQSKSPGNPGTMTGAQLKALLDAIPPCLITEDCDTPSTCCGVTVIIESCYSGQFLGAISDDGRDVITTSSSSEPSNFGADGSGGEYSDRYAECADAGASGVDTNSNGQVEPMEIHACATAALKRNQTPQTSSGSCDCLCPWIIWDCLHSLGGTGVFGPAQWGYNGAPVGDTFAGGPEAVGPEIDPKYEWFKPLVEPNEWLWYAALPCPLIPFNVPMDVQIFNIPTGVQAQVSLELPCWIGDLTSLPPIPFLLQIDVTGDNFILLDQEGTPLGGGPFSLYPNGLNPSQFQPSGIERSNFKMDAPIEIQIEQLSLQSLSPIVVTVGPPRDNHVYYIDVTPNLNDTPFFQQKGPLQNNTSIIDPLDVPGYDPLHPVLFLRARAGAPPP